VNLDDEAVARSVVDRLRERDVRCPRCGGETIALIGTSRRYRCEDCGAAFDGAPHVPDPARQR
jgi:tRNA(Ile2) C34 agmatinyltransferase TiaS